MFFYDWLEIYQDHDFELPLVSSHYSQDIEVETGLVSGIRQPTIKHEGSYSTTITVRISGNRITMKGNPSRFDRLDNLFGFTKLSECVQVYNNILLRLGLPPFTKCTRVWHLSGEDGSRVKTCSDGAVIKELHITSNRSVSKNCVDDYIRGMSTLSYRNSVPRLHTNGKTVDWLSPKGNANLIYPSIYNKAFEIALHHLDKVKRKFGRNSEEYIYLNKVIDYCNEKGVARFEQKLKSRFLQKFNFKYWGLFNEEDLKPIHKNFISIDDRLQVTKMDIKNITQLLLENVDDVNNIKAANTTALYAMNWMHGQTFDCVKRHEQRHRARLRKIGIDIKYPCDITKFSPIRVIKTKQIVVGDLEIPSWYEMPSSRPILKVA